VVFDIMEDTGGGYGCREDPSVERMNITPEHIASWLGMVGARPSQAAGCIQVLCALPKVHQLAGPVLIQFHGLLNTHQQQQNAQLPGTDHIHA
jgi:hypothetical protein